MQLRLESHIQLRKYYCMEKANFTDIILVNSESNLLRIKYKKDQSVSGVLSFFCFLFAYEISMYLSFA
jgi:hypothetical protein